MPRAASSRWPKARRSCCAGAATRRPSRSATRPTRPADSRAVREPHGPSTESVHAGLPPARQGEPFLPGPVFASAFHLAGDDVHGAYGYQRDGNPTWTNYERALGELEGGEVGLFASGMAAVSAGLLPPGPGDVSAGPDAASPGVRNTARDHLAPRGVEVRMGPTDQTRLERDAQGATMLWAETPSN